MTDLSIIIVNWNTKDMLLACLSSIFSRNFSLSVEVIVLDNASTDGSAAAVSKAFPLVKLVASAKNLGFGEGNNEAFKHSTGTWILLLNPDTELKGSVVESTLAYMTHNPSVGLLGVRQVELDGTVQASYGNLPSLEVMILQTLARVLAMMKLPGLTGHLFKRFNLVIPPGLENRVIQRNSNVTPVGWVMGAFMLMPRSLVEGIGLFDSRFRMYAEDIDLCARVRASGKSVVYFDTAEILHHGGASTKSIPVRSDALRFIAMIKYYEKHHPSKAPLYRLLLAAGSLLKYIYGVLVFKRDIAQKGRARLKAAVCASWGGFLA